MTIRSGMSGDAVTQIEQFLSRLKLYVGPVDGSFGGGVESAVKCYQKQQGLQPTGLVDAVTWGRMFPNVPPPENELAKAPLAERCLALTGTFETGSYPPDCFCGIAGNFDKMGLSFGALQWNIGQATLQPMLADMFAQHTDVARDIFHEHFDTITELNGAPLDHQLQFAVSVQTPNYRVTEPWQGMLITLGRTPEFQAIQVKNANTIYEAAVELCNTYGLVSQRAVALMFDIVTQNGCIPATVAATIKADFAKLPVNDPAQEVPKMLIVANRRADAADPAFRDDVRNRKTTIANGAGMVHGITYDLADMYGITLSPFGQAAAAKTA